MSALVAYLIVGLITAFGLLLERYQQERRRFVASVDLIAVPAVLVIVSVAWLPLYAWAFYGPNRHRMRWNNI